MSKQAEVSNQLQIPVPYLQTIPGRKVKRMIPLPPKVRGPVLVGERKRGQCFLIARWQRQVWFFALENESKWTPLRFLMPDELPNYELSPKLELVRRETSEAASNGRALARGAVSAE